MLRNYLIALLRNIARHKGITLINVVGLAIGMASCLLILLFVQDELSYDRHQEKAERTYRLHGYLKAADLRMGSVPWKLGAAMKTHFPDIEAIMQYVPAEILLFREEKEYVEKRAGFVGKEIFDLFDIELVVGNPETALEDPFTMVISEDVARTIFGDENPVGQSLLMQRTKFTFVSTFWREAKTEWTITGIMKPPVGKSHLRASVLMSSATGQQIFKWVLESGNEWVTYTYLLFPEDYPADKVVEQLREFTHHAVGPQTAARVEFSLMPLTGIHLNSHTAYELEPGGNILHVYVFSGLACLILAIACINYMNLATARSANRAREVGIRKALGAGRHQVIGQFLCEAAIISFFALVVALALVELFLPLFNTLSGKELTLSLWDDRMVAAELAGLTLLVALLAGSYPAFFLSSFRPAVIFRGVTRTGTIHGRLRKGLVLVQFGASIALIASAIVIYRQLDFLHRKDLRMETEQVIVAPCPRNYEAYKKRILGKAAVASVSTASERPTARLDSAFVFKAEGHEPDENNTIREVAVDYDFFETLGVHIVQGRDFSREHGSDAEEAVILNEAAVRMLGWKDPIGRRFDIQTMGESLESSVTRTGEVIGVVEDFHFEPLHFGIVPVAYVLHPTWRSWMLVRFSGDDAQGAIGVLKESWEELVTETPFQYSILDDDVAGLYRAEERFFDVTVAFAVLAILIASLGILGLASFTAEQRTREIGIRKVIGASVGNIVLLLGREYVVLVVLASLVAAPVAHYTMSRWLENFAYRIDIGLWVFLLALVLALVLALCTVSYQAIRAALTNPADALRCE